MHSLADKQLLSALLAAILDTHPLERHPVLPVHASVVASDLVLLWDAREEADKDVASAVAAQLGAVIATTATPMVGVLIRVEDAEQAASMLSAMYPVPVGLHGAGEHPV